MNKKILGLGVLSALILSISFFSFAHADVAGIIGNVKRQLVAIGATIVVIGWVIAGILFLTSAGGSRMEMAKKALWAALIGTVLIILAGAAYSLINGLLGPSGGANCPNGTLTDGTCAGTN